MRTYTIALATRLKRKVFLAGNIPSDVKDIVEDALQKRDAHVKEMKFLPYGCICCVDVPEAIYPDRIAYLIRTSTSKPIRDKYPELWSMPSLWNRKTFIREGMITEDAVREINEFYDSLKTR